MNGNGYPPEHKPDFKDRKIGIEIRGLSHMFRRKADLAASYDGTALTGNQSMIIGYLRKHKNEDTYQRDLESYFNIRRATATNILKLMEQNGLIVRTAVEHDARLKRITLTAKAIQSHDVVVHGIEAIEELAKKGISQDEMTAFYKVIDKMEANLKEDSDEY